MFPKRSACFMNPMPCRDDSLRESLKQKMLNQESIFREQVQELHRLYHIQTILMNNFRLKEVPRTQCLNYFNGESRLNGSTYDRRPLVLEVPVSSYTNNLDEHFLRKGKGWGTRENPVEVDDYIPGETEFSLEETKLSLSIGGGSSQRMRGWRTQDENAHSIVPHDIIDLEESIRTVSDRDVELKSSLCCAACSANSGERNGFHSSCSCTNSTNKYWSNTSKKSQSLRDESISILEQNSLSQGDKRCLEKLPETELAVAPRMFPHGAACLDLNSPQPDESFLDSKDLKMDYSSAAASSCVVIGKFPKGTSLDAVSWRKPNDNCSIQVPALLQHDTLNSVLMVSKRTDSIGSGSKVCSIDLESYPMSPSNCSEDHDGLGKASESVPDFPSRNCKDETVTEVNGEKSDKVLVHSYICSTEETVEDVVIDERSPALSKSDHIAQDASSSLKTMQSGTRVERSFCRMNSFQNSDSSQVDSSSIFDTKSRTSDEENGGSAPDDPVIQKGAVSLLYFLLEAGREHDSILEAKKRIETEKEKMHQPERSIDSFESLVLKLQESNTDDYCVTSNAYEINDMDKKDSGIKLRRGRRMKDFQKEILPSLPSLSRQEICEDIRIMEVAIRSREYKRYRSKGTTEQKWFTPVRSRRSRLNYTGRRCYK